MNIKLRNFDKSYILREFAKGFVGMHFYCNTLLKEME